MRNTFKSILIVLCTFLISFSANGISKLELTKKSNDAQQSTSFLTLPSFFSNNMVLQREKPVTIWGNSTPNTNITINLDNVLKTVISDTEGHWETSFNPLIVGGPYVLKISTSDTIISFSNILSGDVWLCSGQSNMEFQLQQELYVAEELPNSKIPDIRMIRMLKQASANRNNEENLSTGWLTCDSLSVKLFSAIAYYFGKKLHSETNVPIGLIGSYWGGSTIEAWMSSDTLQTFPEFSNILERINSGAATLEILNYEADQELQRRNEAIKNNINPETDPYTPYSIRHFPSLLYNGMISPLKKISFKGVIWYQGEANVTRAKQYSRLFPALIKDWRLQLKNPDLPFYFVQLPNYGIVRDYPYSSQWAELREAQEKALVLPNTGMVVTIDVGECDNIHPKNKRDVGNRLAAIALNNLYGKNDIAYKYPRLKSYELKGNSIVCNFENVGNGLNVIGGNVTEFCLAGANNQFYNATAAIIQPDKIEITSNEVIKPIAVRYCWSNCPINGKLFNSENLPLAPFRTDEIALADTIIMRTSKPIGSPITLVLAATGTGTVSIDWGDGIKTLETISTSYNSPTTITKNTLGDKAQITIYADNRIVTFLTCASNSLTDLDVTNVYGLQFLRCHANNLISLDVSNQTNLKLLYCGLNKLTSLDVTNNTKLEDLAFNSNLISSINLSNQTVMRILTTQYNPLGSLDLSANVALITLMARNSGLTNLDLSKNPSITTVSIYNDRSTDANNFTACALDALYSTLSNRLATTAGTINIINSAYVPTTGQLDNDGTGSDKTIAIAKNWILKNYTGNITLTGDGGGCVSTGNDFKVITSKIDIYPNPTTGQLYVVLPNSLNVDKIRIMELGGRIVLEQKVTAEKTILNISQLKKGMYIFNANGNMSKLIIN